MLKDILPDKIFKAISTLQYNDLCEIRLRLGRPVMVNYKNKYYFLGDNGLCSEKSSFLCDGEMMKIVISKSSNFSIYSVNENIKQGFITAQGGIRIGIAGEIVCENNKIITVKNFSSINIRIPHEIKNSALPISKYVMDSKSIFNTLIVGSPGTGKTTILRDLCNQIYTDNINCNILLLDERMEIASCYDGIPQLYVGNSTDIISGGNKHINILNGIRSMSPNVVVIDEIGGIDDVRALEYAVNCGVNIFATVHSKNIAELSKKNELQNLIKQKSFSRFVEISNNSGKGTIENVYDENFNSLLRKI